MLFKYKWPHRFFFFFSFLKYSQNIKVSICHCVKNLGVKKLTEISDTQTLLAIKRHKTSHFLVEPNYNFSSQKSGMTFVLSASGSFNKNCPSNLLQNTYFWKKKKKVFIWGQGFHRLDLLCKKFTTNNLLNWGVSTNTSKWFWSYHSLSAASFNHVVTCIE